MTSDWYILLFGKGILFVFLDGIRVIVCRDNIVLLGREDSFENGYIKGFRKIGKYELIFVMLMDLFVKI